jgi:hypothetical protein
MKLLKRIGTFLIMLITPGRMRAAFDYLRDPEYYDLMQREYRKK